MYYSDIQYDVVTTLIKPLYVVEFWLIGMVQGQYPWAKSWTFVGGIISGLLGFHTLWSMTPTTLCSHKTDQREMTHKGYAGTICPGRSLHLPQTTSVTSRFFPFWDHTGHGFSLFLPCKASCKFQSRIHHHDPYAPPADRHSRWFCPPYSRNRRWW